LSQNNNTEKLRTDNPILQSINVLLDHAIDLGTPGRKAIPVTFEIFDTHSAFESDKVNSLLECEPKLSHNDGNHVVSVVVFLFLVVREDILEIRNVYREYLLIIGKKLYLHWTK
jgi:hypothetical protein